MSNTQVITIDTITIKQDSEGRYCLNDLHKAAGGNSNHQPALFLRLYSTQELIDEIENSTEKQSFVAVYTRMGRNGGTYVVRELVFAYAMWVSAAFHLKVIRAYDRLQTQGEAALDYIDVQFSSWQFLLYGTKVVSRITNVR